MTFLPRSKCLLISWLQSPSAVILESKKIKSFTVSTVSPSTCHELMGPDAMILVFWMLSFKSTFSLSSFTFVKRLFSSSLLSAIRWCHLCIWGCWYFSLPSFFFSFIIVCFNINNCWNQSMSILGSFLSESEGTAVSVPCSAAWGPRLSPCPSLQSWFQLVLHPARHFEWCTLHIS